MTTVKELSGRKFKKVNWGIIIGFLVYTILLFMVILLPDLKTIFFVMLFLWIFMMMAVLFSDSWLYKSLTKFSRRLNARCWIKSADRPFSELYLFDLTNGYLYGLFALNPFSIQRMDLKEVEDVELLYHAHRLVPLRQWKIKVNKMEDVEQELGPVSNGITSGVICRVHMEYGSMDICLWHDRRYQHMWVGQANELEFREEALKFKKLILDLKWVAETRDAPFNR